MGKINVKIFVDRENRNKAIEFDNNATVSNLLKKLDINPVTVIVSRNNDMILEDEKIKNNDEIRILSVISGG
ncbi:MoaD/ThiS family protein [Candidatus Woesearchaeota archaeon]|nr:MoaD/ThiS family protein [Candidatus Woesearchaeota archaeon]